MAEITLKAGDNPMGVISKGLRIAVEGMRELGAERYLVVGKGDAGETKGLIVVIDNPARAQELKDAYELLDKKWDAEDDALTLAEKADA
jgi:hypothetical protein